VERKVNSPRTRIAVVIPCYRVAQHIAGVICPIHNSGLSRHPIYWVTKAAKHVEVEFRTIHTESANSDKFLW